MRKRDVAGHLDSQNFSIDEVLHTQYVVIDPERQGEDGSAGGGLGGWAKGRRGAARPGSARSGRARQAS